MLSPINHPGCEKSSKFFGIAVRFWERVDADNIFVGRFAEAGESTGEFWEFRVKNKERLPQVRGRG